MGILITIRRTPPAGDLTTYIEYTCTEAPAANTVGTKSPYTQ